MSASSVRRSRSRSLFLPRQAAPRLTRSADADHGLLRRRPRLCAWQGMGLASTIYRPRTPADGVVYQVVRDHFETLRAQAGDLREGEGLPRFVEEAAFARSAPASLAEASTCEVGAEAGVSGVARLRVFGRRLRALPLRQLRVRPAGAVQLQGQGGLRGLRPSAWLRASRASSRDGGRRMAERAARLHPTARPRRARRAAATPK